METKTRTLYHGSNDPSLTEVLDSDMFLGVFASVSERSAFSHGGYLFEIELDSSKIATSFDLKTGDWDLAVAATRELMPWATDGEVELVADAATCDDDSIDGLAEALRENDACEMSWTLQKIRGQIARAMGFAAVQMSDEHGTSYLVLAGAELNRKAV